MQILQAYGEDSPTREKNMLIDCKNPIGCDAKLSLSCLSIFGDVHCDVCGFGSCGR